MPDCHTMIVTELSQCEMGEWTLWSDCDAPCGQGTMKRTRSPEGPQYSQGCRTFIETRPCCQQTCQGTESLYCFCSVFIVFFSVFGAFEMTFLYLRNNNKWRIL